MREKRLERALPNSEAIIKMSKKQASAEWHKYHDILKSRGFDNPKYITDIKSCFFQMKKGRKLIDLYVLMKEIGLNENEEPKLAISRADKKIVRFTKRPGGQGVFESPYHYREPKFEISLPKGTFKEFTREKNSYGYIKYKEPESMETQVPIIPIAFLPKGGLENYYILWEVKDWKVVPRDPILLKRITENLFAVIAVWDLTKLEQSVLRGRK